MLLGIFAQHLDRPQQLALDRSGGTGRRYHFIPDLKGDFRIFQPDVEGRLGGMSGMDPGFSPFPADHELLYIRWGNFEPLAGGHTIAGLLIEVGSQAQDLIEYVQMCASVGPGPSQQPALDCPINNIGAIPIEDIDVGFVIEEKVEGLEVFILPDGDVEAVVSPAAANTRVGAFASR